MIQEINLQTAKNLMPPRIADSNKSTFGKILNIAGSKFYQGAAFLSSVCALKTGAGYVTLACPDCILDNIASKSSDITFLPLRSFKNESIASDNAQTIIDLANNFDVISIGCGLSTNSSTIEFIGKLLTNTSIKIPFIIDADALNAISLLELKKIPTKSIITPHPRELSRLLSAETEEIQQNRQYFAKLASEKFNCTTLLKGHNTIITDQTNTTYMNKTGNSALAKAGSGDVLTGIIAALAVKSEDLTRTAALGAFIHGLCADIAAEKQTEYGVLASDLIDYIPLALKLILNV